MIQIDSVTKTYGSQHAVDNASFTAPPGAVTGFLGPNGAGKSTTLTILTGLQSADSGTATIGGRRFTQITRPLREVGVMLNAAALHPGRTGIETLRLAAKVAGVPATAADDALARVGLAGAAAKRVGNYSLGMRQRLGIGVALIGDPHTLILDEPANGLDPEGIRWMRGLLDEFAAGGGTVLLSSHFLGEVQAIADRIVVINRGQIMSEGTTAELLGEGEGRVRVESPDLTGLGNALQAAGHQVEGIDGALIVAAPAEVIAQTALDARILVTGLQPVHHNLEEVFLTMTGGNR